MTPTQQEQEQQLTEEAVEAQVKARQAERKRKEESGEGEGSERTPQQIVRAAAKGEKVGEEEVHDALELFLAQEGEEPEVEPKTLKLNLGTNQEPKFVRWSIVPVDDDEIIAIRKRSQKGTRAQRRRGEAEVDENLVSRRIVTRGTVEPDLTDLSKELRVVDPTDAVLKYFRRFGKTGLILQISGEILNISGYDEDDVSELDAALG